MDIQLPIICWKDCSFPTELFIKNQLTINTGFISDPQFCCTDFYVYSYASTRVFDHHSFIADFEIRKGEFSNFVWFQDWYGLPGSLEFPYELKDQFANFYKKGKWDFGGNCIKTVEQFGEYCCLNNTVSSDLSTWKPFQFFRSLISFNNVFFRVQVFCFCKIYV